MTEYLKSGRIKIVSEFVPTIKWAEEVIAGCEALKNKYRTGGNISCPFCATDRLNKWKKPTNIRDYTCHACPWVLFRNEICHGYYNNGKKNIPRLNGWIVRCKNIIRRLRND